MKHLLLLIIASSVLLFSCRDNDAPTVYIYVPSDKSSNSNNIDLGVAFNLIGAEDLSSLIYCLKNTETDSTYISGDWMDFSYRVGLIAVRDNLNIDNLPQGEYTLEVEAKDDNDNSHTDKVTFNIVD